MMRGEQAGRGREGYNVDTFHIIQIPSSPGTKAGIAIRKCVCVCVWDAVMVSVFHRASCTFQRCEPSLRLCSISAPGEL